VVTRVLIVEEQLLIRDSLERLLSTRPNTEIVVEAADDKAAVSDVKAKAPDVVIFDIDLPHENGMELLAHCKEAAPLAKFIVLTSRMEPALIQKALDLGVSGYISKMNGGSDLLPAIDTVLGGSVYLCPVTTTVYVKHSQQREHGLEAAVRFSISPRELEVLRCIVRGLRNKEIAAELGIGIKSVETYRSRVMKRSGSSTPAELVRFAFKQGLVEL
jgi:DNA-binding NarL/FixJ family response regulator